MGGILIWGAFEGKETVEYTGRRLILIWAVKFFFVLSLMKSDL